MGFEALARILEVCYKSGVKVVTIYAFSIENFKRSKYEVDALMEMAKTKLTQLAQHGALLDRYGASIRILGQRELVKADVLEAVKTAERLTANNKRCILNVCFPYTSREEITGAVQRTVSDFSKPHPPPLKRPFSETHITRNLRAQSSNSIPDDTQSENSVSRSASTSSSKSSQEQERGSSTADAEQESSAPTLVDPADKDEKARAITYPDSESITADTLTANMLTADAPPLDLLVRTSGVQRLSDFMLWQCHQKTSIVFLDCLWPEFDLWNFLPVLVEWQWQRKKQIENGRGRLRDKED